MSEKKDRKSKREGTLSNVCILIDDGSIDETKPLKEIVTGIQPNSYEDELIFRRTEIQRDRHRGMLLFPEDDVTVYKISRELRTECSTVPPQAYNESSSMFVRECVKSYTQDWFVVESQYKQYSGSYHQLPCKPDVMKTLENQIFEIDIEESEVDGGQDSALVAQKEKGIFKEGYLTKAPFHSESSSIYGSKTFKRRWFTLKQASSDGSYLLEYKKDEASTMAKGTLYLDSCTHITKHLKGRIHGFELHIQDKVYGLVADSSAELNSWVGALCKATGIDIEQEKTLRSFFGGRKVQAKHSNFKESLRQSSHPLLLEYAHETDSSNTKKRQKNRSKLFPLYSNLGGKYDVSDTIEDEPAPFREAISTRILIDCQKLLFRLRIQNDDGDSIDCEPFFTTWCLFDVREGRKLSEDFCCDMNEPFLKDMLNPIICSQTNVSQDDRNRISPKQAVFSVTSPHSEVYIVVRITKILQGGISQCVEPYMKATDGNNKSALKIQRHAAASCKRLMKYMMPFGWAMRPIFKNKQGELDNSAEFSPIYKQETTKLADEDFIKLITDVKADKTKQQIIPGQIKCSVRKLNTNQPNCYTPSLVPVKPFSDSDDIPISLEVQEFTSEKPDVADPFTSYVNHFYVYPIALNYSNQKVFSKARNLAIKIEFKDSDELNSKPLRSIYNKDGSCTMVTSVIVPVLYHNTTPTFYEEAKILLPTHLHNKHHILFTFYHVSVEQPKHDPHVKKKHDVEVPVGQAWMKILENGIVRADKSELSVTAFLPEGYLSHEKNGGSDLRWVEGKGAQIFKVNTKLISTIYTKDLHLNNFFGHWQLNQGRPGSEVETSRLLKLMHAIDVTNVIQFLPVILNQLFEVLLSIKNDDVSVNVIRTLIRIITQIHEVDKGMLLKSYVKYSFRASINRPKTVHEEVTKNLRFYLKPGSDPAIIDCILQRAWFFFEIIIKSMAQSHLSSDKSQSSKHQKLFDVRDARFSTEFHSSIENLLQVFVAQLVKKRQDKFQVSKDAVMSLASFIKKCFTHMDRGFVFQMANYVKDQFKSPDPQMFELKFEFLRAISEHEHFVALNLPLDVRVVGGVHESTLNDTFCRKHFLVGLILKEFTSALNEGKAVRGYAIKVIRNLLAKHELDDRYQAEEKQSRIAALYIPLLATILEHALRFHKSLDRPFIDDSLLSTRPHVISPSSGRASPAPSRSSMISSAPLNNHRESQDVGNKNTQLLPFDDDEKKELLLCILFILKTLNSEMIVDWWRDLVTTVVKRPHWTPTALYYVHDKNFGKFSAVIDFFDLIDCCLHAFCYLGRRAISDSSTSPESTKQYIEKKYKTVSNFQQVAATCHKKTASEGRIDVLGMKALAREYSENDHERRILLDANFANEASLIVLDTVELFCTHIKHHLEQDAGDNILMKKIFNVLMGFFRTNQSEYVLMHVFASLRSFIHKFPSALFKGSANLCGILCYEVLKMCNSKIESIRTEACCFMYLLMRYNYEFSGTGCVRVHLQVIVAVSKLIASGMNRSAMYSSLTIVKNYAVDDKGMKKTEFPAEVRDLIKKVHTVLQATEKMKEHEDDHEVLVDLQYSLAKSYSSTPELRQTWLQNIADIHERNGDFSEAAMCYIHAAALVAEYLKRKGMYVDGCAVFRAISPNLVPDECAMKNDDEGNSDEVRYRKRISWLMQDLETKFIHPYDRENLISLLESGIELLKRAERYEVIGAVYKIAIPLYEEDREFSRLAVAYASLHDAYAKIVDVMASGKRLLGRYYRVAFYGRAFKDDDGKEYIYKEPKLTSLPEISERLQNKYQAKYGNLKILQDSSKVKAEELNPAVNYIQLTFVRPHFDEEELQRRSTDFERENNIRRFVFETPFTLSGKAHGNLSEQYKRKTILTTSHSFPYVKKRILVVQQEMYELSPLEVAIEEMQTRLKDLDHVINLDPPDMKKLQLKLQGSVSVQVNAGPLAYATTFLSSSVIKEYPAKHIETLKSVYREFITFCGRALELNSMLIKPDQLMYQEDLRSKYEEMKEKLAPFVGFAGSLESLASGFRQSYTDSDV